MHLWKEFVKYTSLNVLGMLALSCYILADTFLYRRDWERMDLQRLIWRYLFTVLFTAVGL